MLSGSDIISMPPHMLLQKIDNLLSWSWFGADVFARIVPRKRCCSSIAFAFL